MRAALSMAETAEAVGLSWERFRKVWRRWTRKFEFPSPFVGGAGQRATYSWDPEAVETWRQARTRAGLPAAPGAAPQAANDTRPPPLPRAKVNQDRAELARMMMGGAGR